MASCSGNTVVTRWLLDTRSLWPGTKIQDTAARTPLFCSVSRPERASVLRKYQIADARMSLASALIKRAYISKCLKDSGAPPLAWNQIEFTRWPDPVHGKPIWSAPKHGVWPEIDFNVSHQGGLVILVGACTFPATPIAKDVSTNGTTLARGAGRRAEATTDKQDEHVLVGCDIVKLSERADFEAIRNEDFDKFTSTFAEVFSFEELFNIIYTLPSNELILPSGYRVSTASLGRQTKTIFCDQDVAVLRPGCTEGTSAWEKFNSVHIIDAKLRRFYTYFALKEAYVKLVGEGLLAPWIKEAEFRNVRAPAQGPPVRFSTHGVWGGKIVGGGGRGFEPAQQPAAVTAPAQKQQPNSSARRMPKPTRTVRFQGHDDHDMELWLRNGEVQDTRMEVQAFEDDFVMATMVQPASVLLSLGGEFPAWKSLDLEQDVLAWGLPAATKGAKRMAAKPRRS